MTRKDVEGRVRRLRALAEGFAREVALWRQTPGPLLPAEHKSYLRAIQDAIADADEAHVILERVLQRLLRDTP